MARRQNPLTSPELELQNVQEELDATKKRLERYTDLVAKLYDELDRLRNTICDKCKKKAVQIVAASFGGRRSPSPAPLGPRVLENREGPNSPSSPGLNSSNSLIGATNSTRSAAAEHANATEVSQAEVVDKCKERERSGEETTAKKRTQSAPPTAVTPAVHPPSEIGSSDYSESPISLLTTTPADKIRNSSQLKHDWSVVYNTDIQQTLDLCVAETLMYYQIVRRVKFSRNGKYLAVGLEGGETHIYELNTLSKRVLAEHTAKEKYGVYALQFSQDDSLIVTGLSDGRIQIWNIAQKRVRAMFKGHTDHVLSVDFSPDGRFLVSASWDKTIRLWCMRDGSSKELSDVASLFNSVAFSPHGRYVFSGNNDGFLRIWDTRTNELRKWKGHDGVVWCATPSKDGKGLASGGRDKILKYWDISPCIGLGPGSGNFTGKEILRFEGHTGTIISTHLSSDGRWIVSAGSGAHDCTVRIWDAKTTAWQCTLKGHKEVIEGADLSPTGQFLASGGLDGCVRLWKLDITE